MLNQEDINNSTPELAKVLKNKMLIVDHANRYSTFYTSEQEYQKLQSLLNSDALQINFIFANLQDFPKILNKKYDFIYLSNIYDYFSSPAQKKIFEKTVNLIYQKNLNAGGKIILQYDLFTKIESPPKTFAGLNVSTQCVPRLEYDSYETDTVWIINKNDSTQTEHCK